LRRLDQAGVKFVNISPVQNNLDTGGAVDWIPIRPNTDAALILALCHTLYTEGLHSAEFLARCCTGFEKFLPYLTGVLDGQPKTAQWAESITGVAAERMVALARAMARHRTMVSMAWSLQRAHHGEQPFWALVTLASMLGQIGLPGGGFGVGYGTTNMIGNANAKFAGPVLPQGHNAVPDFIPVSRITDMLEQPGAPFDYNGARRHYPDIRLIYWAGGNPFHHHQDLNRLLAAWQSRPETIVVHEQFWTPAAKLADIVLPATTTLERNDIGYASRERFMVAMKQAMDPVGEARDDYDIFTSLAERLGTRDAYTEGLNSQQWLARIYEEARTRAARAGHELPAFGTFWDQEILDLSLADGEVVMFRDFRADPVANPLGTPSGRIELFSERIDGFGYPDCPGHTCWIEPAEWLGGDLARQFPLHLLTDQPLTKLHSQLDHAAYSTQGKIAGREPLMMAREDALARKLADGDLVRVFNARGACLAALQVSDQILPGVVKLSTGAWFDPSHWNASGPGNLEKHGNPNVLTLDIGASSLSQGCIAQTCLVQVERFDGVPPALTPYALPVLDAQA
jgi:biotin/methionine sulfoxide reductase